MKKKRLGIIIGMLIAMNAATAFAGDVRSDDDHSYSFNIKANYANTYSESRYRQTTNTKNKWKVNMTHSAEGAGTITTYWLALFNSGHDAGSDAYDVTQGTGAHYYNAYSNASQKDVCLGAENNNNSTNTYTVSGYWDEETN